MVENNRKKKNNMVNSLKLKEKDTQIAKATTLKVQRKTKNIRKERDITVLAQRGLIKVDLNQEDLEREDLIPEVIEMEDQNPEVIEMEDPIPEITIAIKVPINTTNTTNTTDSFLTDLSKEKLEMTAINFKDTTNH
jgi:hypothetical protein